MSLDTSIPSLKDALRGLEWEAEHGTLDTGRYRMPYARWGSGHPLIFVHGLADHLQSSAWLMRLLVPDYQCITYKQPAGDGDGASLKKYGHNDLVNDLFALMNHLKIPQATVVAHSFGTSIALQAMRQRAFRIPRSVLLCGFARRPLNKLEWWLAQMGRVAWGRLRQLPGFTTAMQEMHKRSFASQEDEVWQFYLDGAGQTPARAMAHWARLLHGLDFRTALPEIKQPSLVITCSRDPVVPQEHQRQLFEGLANSTMLELQGCGHFPMLTRPEALADAIRRFVPQSTCAFHASSSAMPDGLAMPECPS